MPTTSAEKQGISIQNIYQLVLRVPQPVGISAGYKQPGQLLLGLTC